MKTELGRVYNDYVSDVIDGPDARCRKELLAALKDTLTATEIEQKLVALEQMVAGRVTPLKRVS